MAFETTICQECPTPIQWPSLRAAYLRCINIELDTRNAMLKDCDARIAALQAQVKALTADRDAQAEAVKKLGRLAYCQAKRERLLDMDPDSKHPEVAEEQIANGIALIRVMGEVSANPIAAAALKGEKES